MKIVQKGSNGKTKVSSDDIPGYLLDKLAAGSGITLTQVSDGGGGEAVEIAGTTGTGIPELEPTEISGATAGLVGKLYTANNISRVIVTLPATGVFGDKIGLIGKGAGGWRIQANSGQVIHLGGLQSIDGGYVQSGTYSDDIILMCITADTNWKMIWGTGMPEVETS